MNSGQLTSAQIAVLQSRLLRMLDYLFRLRDRMKAQEFPADDKVFVETLTAITTVHALTSTLGTIQIDRALAEGAGPRAKREWEREQREKRG